MVKRTVQLFSLLAGALLLAACSGGSSGGTTTIPGPSSSGEPDVSIENFAFGPDAILISVGDTVLWTNDASGTAHTSTSEDGLWDSGNIPAGSRFERTFDEAGTFAYICTIHPSMMATIAVSG
jgi:plastocyanin